MRTPVINHNHFQPSWTVVNWTQLCNGMSILFRHETAAGRRLRKQLHGSCGAGGDISRPFLSTLPRVATSVCTSVCGRMMAHRWPLAALKVDMCLRSGKDVIQDNYTATTDAAIDWKSIIFHFWYLEPRYWFSTTTIWLTDCGYPMQQYLFPVWNRLRTSLPSWYFDSANFEGDLRKW